MLAMQQGVDWRRVAVWCCRGVLVVWAAFWTWFALAGALSPGHGWGEVWIVALPAIALGAIAWRWPVVGGVLLIGAGVFSAWFFDHTAARLMLALPVVVVGTVLLLASSGAGRNA